MCIERETDIIIYVLQVYAAPLLLFLQEDNVSRPVAARKNRDIQLIGSSNERYGKSEAKECTHFDCKASLLLARPCKGKVLGKVDFLFSECPRCMVSKSYVVRTMSRASRSS